MRLIPQTFEFLHHRSKTKLNSLKHADVEYTKETSLSGNSHEMHSWPQGVCPFPIPAGTQHYLSKSLRFSSVSRYDFRDIT